MLWLIVQNHLIVRLVMTRVTRKFETLKKKLSIKLLII